MSDLYLWTVNEPIALIIDITRMIYSRGVDFVKHILNGYSFLCLGEGLFSIVM